MMVTRLLAIACVVMLPFAGAAQEPTKPRLDADGNPLPEGAVARLGDLRYAQRGSITGIATSPDGKIVATSGAPGRGRFGYGEEEAESVYLFDAETGRVTREITVGAEAIPLRFSNDGKLLAVGYHIGFMLLDVATGKPWWPADAKQRPHRATRVHFLDNDHRMVLEGVGTYHSVEVWDLTRGTRSKNWEIVKGKDRPEKYAIEALKLEGSGMRVALSPSGATMVVLVTFLEKGDNYPSRAEVHLFDTLTGERKSEALRFASFMNDVALLDEGDMVLMETCFRGKSRFGRDDIGGNVAIDTKTGKEKFRIHHIVGRHRDETTPDPYPLQGVTVHTVAPDGKSFYTFGHKEGYFRRDSATGKSLGAKLEGHSSGGNRTFAFTSDPKKTVLADRARWHWGDLDLKPLTTPTENAFPYPGAVYLSNTRVRMLGAGNTFRVWDLKEGKFVEAGKYPVVVRRPEPSGLEWRFPKSYDGDRRVVVANYQRRLVVYDLVAGRELSRLEGVSAEGDGVHWPAVTDDGSRVLVPLADGNDLVVNWYDVKTGRKQGSYRVTKADVFPGRFPFAPYGDTAVPAAHWRSDDGSVFGYLTRDSRLTLVDTATGKVTGTLGIAVPLAKQPEEKPPEVKPAPLGGGLQPMLLVPPPRPPVPAWAYWRQGPFVVASRNTSEDVALLRRRETEYALFDPRTGAMLRRFVLPTADVRAFSPDGRFAFARTGWDGVVVYETATGLPRGTIQTNAGGLSLYSLAVAPDGKTMATGCADTTVLVWDLNGPLGGGPALAPADAPGGTSGVYFNMLEFADPGTAEPALWALVRAPERTLKMLKDRLKPADKADAKLFEEPQMPERTLRNIRALEVLERIGTPEAKQLVEAVATGHADALLTREAKLILARWSAKAAVR